MLVFALGLDLEAAGPGARWWCWSAWRCSGSPIPGLVGSLFALFTKFGQDTSTTVRQERYEIAGHYFLQHPWFGRGYNTLYPATQQVFDNAYLYVATEQGAFGLVGDRCCSSS